VILADLTEACGVEPGNVCRWVYDATNNTTLAKIADWLVGRPLRIVVIVLVAVVVNVIVRRALSRIVTRTARGWTDQIERSNRYVDARWLETLRDRNERAKQRALTLAGVLKSVASVVIYGVAALMCLGELGIDLGPLLAGAGIAGIAIGLGAQSLVRDFLAGMFIVLEDQYGVGDDVSLGEASGKVENVTLRTTWLRDIEGTLWVVPNGEIRRVANHSQRWARAVLDVRIAPNADVDVAIAVAREAAQAFYDGREAGDALLAAPKVLGIESFTDTAAVLRITVKTEPGSQYDVARRLRVAMRKAFLDAGVLAVPDA
jgi:small-conductance mechanosensitive channel